MIKDRLLSFDEAAPILGVSVKTLYCWSSERVIDVVKVGRLAKLRESTINDIVTNGISTREDRKQPRTRARTVARTSVKEYPWERSRARPQA